MSVKDFLNNMEDQDLAMFLRYMKIQEAEKAAILGKSNKEILQLFMERRAEQDPDVRDAYTKNPLGKTINDAYEYIFDYARQNARGQNMAALTSMTVFQMVEQYFTDPEIKKFEKAKPVATTKTAAKKQSKLEDLKADIQILTRGSQDWETAHMAKVEKWVKEHEQELFFDPNDNPHLKEVNPYLDKLTAKEQELQSLGAAPASAPVAQEPAPAPETEPEIEADEDEDEPDEDAIGEIVSAPSEPEQTIIKINGSIVDITTGEEIGTETDAPAEEPDEDEIDIDIEEEEE